MHLLYVSVRLTYTNRSKCQPTTNTILSGSALGASFDPLLRGVHLSLGACHWFCKKLTHIVRSWTSHSGQRTTENQKLQTFDNNTTSLSGNWNWGISGYLYKLDAEHEVARGQNHGNLDTEQHDIMKSTWLQARLQESRYTEIWKGWQNSNRQKREIATYNLFLHSKDLSSRNKPAASLIRENSMQNACTSMKRSWTACTKPWTNITNMF